ncbi:MAG: YgiQ family radical SAM protein [Deltaproteobacteria bacterium]|nr:YgiQ family radical SAM protein [Deltaproteobacteria bacterium]
MALVTLGKDPKSKKIPARPGPEAFLPTTLAEAKERGWAELDVVLINGDAYVDHPTFGVPLIGRLLVSRGYKVGIISQPDWAEGSGLTDFMACGKPRLFFGVSSGNMDSMVNHYTAGRKRRSNDAYTPDAEPQKRPDYATAIYARRLKKLYPDVPVIIGGVEASLRRLAHYDYWSDRVRHSILVDCPADVLVYGMGEAPILEVAQRLREGEDVSGLTNVRGTAVRFDFDPRESREKDSGAAWRYLAGERDRDEVWLPSYDEICADKQTYAEFSRLYHLEHNPDNARILLQPHGNKLVFINPPAVPPTTELIDAEYELPFTRLPHPMYGERKIPAWEQIRFSVTIMRGCAAGCSFCCITEHQGRDVVSRSEASVLREIEGLKDVPGWTGVVSDIGGATANMWHMVCTDDAWHQVCRRASCLYPNVCEKFGTDHAPLIQLMKKARELPGVKRAFVASGVRYDLAFEDPAHGDEYIRELVSNHVGGHLKIAPEHISPGVVRVMKKPGKEMFERFRELFDKYSAEAGKEQYLVPYFISSHPGCETKDMVELSDYLSENGWRPQQVQDFTPTPMTLATDMFYSGFHPNTGKPVHVPSSPDEKAMQRALLQPHLTEYRELAAKARKIAGAEPLPEHVHGDDRAARKRHHGKPQGRTRDGAAPQPGKFKVPGSVKPSDSFD